MKSKKLLPPFLLLFSTILIAWLIHLVITNGLNLPILFFRPAWLWLAALLPLLFFALLSLDGASTRVRIPLALIRIAVFSLLIASAADPSMRSREHGLSLVILADTSASISEEGRLEITSKIRSLLSALKGSSSINSVTLIAFGGHPTLVPLPSTRGELELPPITNPPSTDIAAALRMAHL
ncbi:MAG: VWA domain-containing protein, partial [Deltaproteobacteria bacterium]|nr:VWA domain-containing protein [Deltaproteobacteria bacterium]